MTDHSKSVEHAAQDNTRSLRRYMWAGLVTLGALIGGLGSWAYLAAISGAVIAQGALVQEGRSKVIQHLEGGIVGAIHIREGDKVKAGQKLITLDAEQLTSRLAISENRLQEAMSLKARLEAERDEAKMAIAILEKQALGDPETYHRMLIGQQKLQIARKQAREGQHKRLNSRIAQLKDQIAGMEVQKDARIRQLKLIEQELSGVKALKKQGHTTITRVLSLEREQARLQGAIGGLTTDIARIRNGIGETEIQIIQVDRNFREKVLTELRQTSAQVQEASEEYNAIKGKLKRIVIRAPVAGAVQEVAIHTIGGVVGAGAALMKIVPSDGEMLVETRVDPQHIDQLYVGQAAIIRLSAFSQRSTPELNGKISVISADSLRDPNSGSIYYSVRVALPKKELDRLGDLELVPGMPAEAYLQTGERKALTYLIKPLTDQISKTWRED